MSCDRYREDHPLESIMHSVASWTGLDRIILNLALPAGWCSRALFADEHQDTCSALLFLG